jgi:hypothetical protein
LLLLLGLGFIPDIEAATNSGLFSPRDKHSFLRLEIASVIGRSFWTVSKEAQRDPWRMLGVLCAFALSVVFVRCVVRPSAASLNSLAEVLRKAQPLYTECRSILNYLPGEDGISFERPLEHIPLRYSF